jgi:hypothetical protein
MPSPKLEYVRSEDRYPEANAVAIALVRTLLEAARWSRPSCGRAFNLLTVAYYKQQHGEGR